MENIQKGFTLVELIIVMVILAIVVAIAVPRFVNQNNTARQNTTNSTAAALSAASSENFSKRSANPSLGLSVSNCTAIGALLENGLPAGYSITSQPINSGSTVTCVLNGTGNTTANFVGLGIS